MDANSPDTPDTPATPDAPAPFTAEDDAWLASLSRRRPATMVCNVCGRDFLGTQRAIATHTAECWGPPPTPRTDVSDGAALVVLFLILVGGLVVAGFAVAAVWGVVQLMLGALS